MQNCLQLQFLRISTIFYHKIRTTIYGYIYVVSLIYRLFNRKWKYMYNKVYLLKKGCREYHSYVCSMFLFYCPLE